MEEKNHSEIVPEQRTGKVIDTASSIEFENGEETKKFFEIVKERLLNVNSWHELTGAATAEFQLVDQDGKEVNRQVKKGDYFKIDVPGPGSASGEGYDWVKVEDVKTALEADTESVGIRVRPCPNPQNTDHDVAHFYSEESTSNFVVAREGNRITAGIYDRNTKYNHEGDGLDKLRHWVVGQSAVKAFSKFQWKRLADGLLER